MSTRSFCFTAPLALAAALFSTLAQAQSTCEASADCPKGYECQITGGTACVDFACAPGEECPTPPECEPQEFKDCVAIPNACASDADCSEGMACYTHTYEECSTEPAYACAPGEECPTPPPPECSTTTQSSCVPRYMLPCQAAADCGAGFECKPVEICECSASSGGSTPPSDGAGGAPEPAPEPVPPEEPSCTCTQGDTSYCAIIETVCATDAECPTDWTCGDNPEGVVCSGSSPAPDGAGGAAPTPDPDCGPTEPDKICLPPYASTVIGVSREGAVYASDEDAGDQAGLGEGAPTADPTLPTAPGGSSEESDSGESGGCNVAGSSSGSGAWLALLGLAALLRRRK